MQRGTTKSERFVISGIGPAGLACAWEAAKNGKDVLIVSNREESFIRPQRIHLSQQSRHYLWKMCDEIEDDQITDKLTLLAKKIGDPVVALKDIERYIKECLNIRFPTIQYQYSSEIVGINMNDGIVQIENKTNNAISHVHFTYLAGADGVQHHAATVLNQNPQNRKIHYSDINQDLHPYHMTAYVVLENANMLPKESCIIHLVEERDSQLLCYLYINKDTKSHKIKCNFLGEVPKEIYEEKDQSVAMAYINKTIGDIFSSKGLEKPTVCFPAQSETRQHKDLLSLQIFHRKMTQADRFAIEQGSSIFYVLGDSFKTPDYHLGRGGNNALLHAKKVGMILGMKKYKSGWIDVDMELSRTASDECQASSALSRSKKAHTDQFTQFVKSEEKAALEAQKMQYYGLKFRANKISQSDMKRAGFDIINVLPEPDRVSLLLKPLALEWVVDKIKYFGSGVILSTLSEGAREFFIDNIPLDSLKKALSSIAVLEGLVKYLPQNKRVDFLKKLGDHAKDLIRPINPDRWDQLFDLTKAQTRELVQAINQTSTVSSNASGATAITGQVLTYPESKTGSASQSADSDTVHTHTTTQENMDLPQKDPKNKPGPHFRRPGLG